MFEVASIDCMVSLVAVSTKIEVELLFGGVGIMYSKNGGFISEKRRKMVWLKNHVVCFS